MTGRPPARGVVLWLLAGLDYELGTEKVDARIWDAGKRGEDPERYKRRHDNPLWQVLRRELAGRR